MNSQLMNRLFIALLIGGAISLDVHGDVTNKLASSKFAYAYEADELPHLATPAWQQVSKSGDAYISTSNGVLSVDTSIGNTRVVYWRMND